MQSAIVLEARLQRDGEAAAAEEMRGRRDGKALSTLAICDRLEERAPEESEGEERAANASEPMLRRFGNGTRTAIWPARWKREKVTGADMVCIGVVEEAW